MIEKLLLYSSFIEFSITIDLDLLPVHTPLLSADKEESFGRLIGRHMWLTSRHLARGWYSRDSLCYGYGVRARMAHI